MLMRSCIFMSPMRWIYHSNHLVPSFHHRINATHLLRLFIMYGWSDLQLGTVRKARNWSNCYVKPNRLYFLDTALICVNFRSHNVWNLSFFPCNRNLHLFSGPLPNEWAATGLGCDRLRLIHWLTAKWLLAHTNKRMVCGRVAPLDTNSTSYCSSSGNSIVVESILS